MGGSNIGDGTGVLDRLGELKLQDKPRVTINVTLESGSYEASDEVKYIVTKPKSIFWEIQTRPELRAAFTSKAVYGYNPDGVDDPSDLPYDLPNYGLEWLDNEKLEEYEIPADLKQYLNKNGGPSGFIAGLYRDYVEGPASFTVVYGGTNMESIDDWMNNSAQFLAGGAPQFSAAMELADGLNVEMPNLPKIVGKPFRLRASGHSLGGGLASAAALWANLPGSHTYNSSGLTRATLVNFSNLPSIPDRPDSFRRYDAAAAESPTHLKAYHLSLDILSVLQDATPLLQSAVGKRIPLQGPHSLDIHANWVKNKLQEIVRNTIKLDLNGNVTFDDGPKLANPINDLYDIFVVGIDVQGGLSKLQVSHSFYQQAMLGVNSLGWFTPLDYYGKWLLDDGSPDPKYPVGGPLSNDLGN